MKQVKLSGVILVENNMGDFDKMLTMLTPNGKIGCSARGARRPKSLLLARHSIFVLRRIYAFQKWGPLFNQLV